MKAYKLIFDRSTFGITSKSLKMLRNAIADNIHDEILVVEIPTTDICSGFLLLNKTASTATWSGDGFRHDKGGEGGRGYLAAHKMLDVFGIRYLNVFPTETIKMFEKVLDGCNSEAELSRELLKACNKAAENFNDDEFKCVYEVAPWY